MNADQFAKVADIFEAARQLPSAERDDYINNAADGDSAVIAEVARLLSNHDDDSGLFSDSDVGEGVMKRVIAEVATSSGADALEMIGSYRIVRVLGRGEMGTVYEAVQQRPQRTVALKVLSSGFDSSASVHRFEYESEQLALLKHPGIAQVFEVGMAEIGGKRRPFFVMELIEGKTLREYFSSEQPSENEKLELLAKVCDAVQHAHERGVVHRDLKPGNLLIDGAGNPKVLDFGIARIVESDVHVTQLGAEASVGGLGYLSPEQASGDSEQIDARSDIYSLGVILYEATTGKQLVDVENKSLYEVLRTIREVPVAAPSTIVRSLRGDPDAIVLKALEKEKARRYASAAELAGDLRGYLRGEAVAAHPPSAAYQLRKLAGKNRLAASFAAIVFIAALLAAGFALLRVREAERVGQDTERKLAHARAVSEFLRGMFESIEQNEHSGDAKLIDLLARASRDLSANTQLQPGVRAALQQSLGTAYEGLSRPEEAASLLRKSLEFLEKDSDGLTEEAAEARFRLGSVLQQEGELLAAKELLSKALATQEELLGAEHVRVARTLASLGQVLNDLKEQREGIAMLERNLAIHEKAFDGKHALVVASLHRLATMLSRADPKRAEPLFRRALDMSIELGGSRSVMTARVKAKYAEFLLSWSRYSEADPLLEDVVEVVERVKGPNDLELAWALTNRADFLSSSLRPREAAPIALRALRIRQSSFEGDHVRVAESLGLLAEISLALGDSEGLEKYSKEAISQYTKLSGPQSQDVLEQYNLRAEAMRMRGEIASVLEEKKRLLAILERSNQVDGELGAKLLTDVGMLSAEVGKKADAVSYLRRCLDVRAKLSSPDAEETLVCEWRLAEAMMHAGGDIAEIRKLYEHAVPALARALGRSSPGYAYAAQSMAEFEFKSERFGAAEKLFAGAREGFNNLPEALLRVDVRAAATLLALKRYEEAEVLLLRCKERESTRETLSLLAKLYAETQRQEKADEIAEKLGSTAETDEGDATKVARTSETPKVGSKGPVLTPPFVLKGPAFHAPNARITHKLSLWQVRRWDGEYTRNPVYTTISTKHLTELPIPAGVLEPGAAYSFRVLQLASDDRSPGYLPEQSFTTGKFDFVADPIDLSAIFTRDVVMNPGDADNGYFDGEDKGLLVVAGYDGTRTNAEEVQGMPLSREVGVHRLGDYDEKNAIQLRKTSADLELPISGKYAAIRCLLSGGNGKSRVEVSVEYTEGEPTKGLIPCDDWFHDNPPDRHGNTQPGVTPVYNGMDRWFTGVWEDCNDPGLFEIIVRTDPDREISKVRLLASKGVFEDAKTRMNIFAVTAVLGK